MNLAQSRGLPSVLLAKPSQLPGSVACTGSSLLSVKFAGCPVTCRISSSRRPKNSPVTRIMGRHTTSTGGSMVTRAAVRISKHGQIKSSLRIQPSQKVESTVIQMEKTRRPRVFRWTSQTCPRSFRLSQSILPSDLYNPVVCNIPVVPYPASMYIMGNMCGCRCGSDVVRPRIRRGSLDSLPLYDLLARCRVSLHPFPRYTRPRTLVRTGAVPQNNLIPSTKRDVHYTV
ncbi:hypothetical protein EDC04DRAFT_2191668 [Pisolithus marmoratus]|nr:hypothetical protein EDC04DRAFT_2191668 [Pisolithus marmoratus]